MTAAETLGILGGIYRDRHEYAKEWKERTGGRMLGYLSVYVPEEIIHAAGVLPVRVLGSHEPQDVTEPHIWSSRYCCFSRDCLAQGLRGRYSYLDGIVTSHGCQHMLQVFDSWRTHIPTSYSHFLFVPHNLSAPSAKNALLIELGDFESSLERWIGNHISEEAMSRAIEVYNTNRRLMQQIYQLRKSDAPPISGEETLRVTLSSMVMDKEEHNNLLEQLLSELPGRDRKVGRRARLMVIGCDFDDPELFRVIEESLGVDIVIDDMGTGSRYSGTEARADSAPAVAIADRLLNTVPDPVHDIGTTRRRPSHVLQLAEEYRVDCVAVVFRTFCESHQWDIPAIRSAFEGSKIPVIAVRRGGPVRCVRSKCEEGVVKALKKSWKR